MGAASKHLSGVNLAMTDTTNPLNPVRGAIGNAVGGVTNAVGGLSNAVGLTDMMYGDDWNVEKLSRQLQSDVTISMSIFLLSNIAACFLENYWRPQFYDIMWIFLGVVVWACGFFMGRKKNSFGLAGFVLLLTILACVNISHTMTMKDQHSATCMLAQSSFQGCQGVKSLEKCFPTNTCTKSQL